MTFTDDYIYSEEEDKELEAAVAPNYPTAFGVTLTPAVSGILIAVLGLGGGLYLILNMVMPTMQHNQELKDSREQKQALIIQKQAGLGQTGKLEANLAEAQRQKADVLTLFADEKTLNTLLLDLNRLIESSNASAPPNAKAQLKRFVPANQSTAEIVTDGSLGAEVNGKLKRRVVNIEFVGTFEQTQSIIRNIERLQPLLIVKDYQSSAIQAEPNAQNQVTRGPAMITTSFQLQALIPLNSDEAAQAAAATTQQQK